MITGLPDVGGFVIAFIVVGGLVALAVAAAIGVHVIRWLNETWFDPDWQAARRERALAHLVPGVPDDQLQWTHANFGGGRGTVAITHLPSGLAVSRECPPGVACQQVEEEILAELKAKLRARGLLPSEEKPTSASA